MKVRMAQEMTGVGVTPQSRWIVVCTSFAASTSSAVRWSAVSPNRKKFSSPASSGISMVAPSRVPSVGAPLS